MPTTLDLAERFAGIIALQQQILDSATDPERVMQTIVEKTAGITGGSGAIIERLVGHDLVFTAASGPAGKFIGMHVPIEQSLSGVAVTTRALVRSDDADVDSRVDVDACKAVGIRSMVLAPLLECDVATGVLTTYSSRPNHFNDLDAYALQLLAGLTASALFIARQYRQRQVSEERYRMLVDQNVAGVFRTTMAGQIVDCNRAFADYLGYGSREELLARESWDLYPQRSDREDFLSLLKRDRVMRNYRINLKRKDGSSVAGVVNVSLVPADGGDTQLLGTLVEE